VEELELSWQAIRAPNKPRVHFVLKDSVASSFTAGTQTVNPTTMTHNGLSIEERINFTTATAASVNPNVGDQLVTEGLRIACAQTAACKPHCDVVTSLVLQKVLLGSKGGSPLPPNLSPQRPSVCISSDSDIRRQMLNFTHQSAVHYMTFTSSSIERVEHVAMLARASPLVLKVKVEAMTKKVSPVPANPSGDPQARNIPTRCISCRIVKPIPQVRENPHSFFDMKPTTMVRKNPPFARTFDLRLKEKEHYSDPTFVRTILISLNENAVYDVGAINRVKQLWR